MDPMDSKSLAELQAAKEMAEEAQRRSAFLAEASALLTASLDYEDTLRSLARLTVPRVGDYCILYEIDESREVRQVATAHVDPAKEPLLVRLGEIYRPSLDREESFVARTVQSGTLDQLRHLSRNAVRAVVGRDPAGLAGLDGVHDLTSRDDPAGHAVAFDVEADHLDPVMRALGDLGLRSLVTTPPSLEELFLREYGDAAVGS